MAGARLSLEPGRTHGGAPGAPVGSLVNVLALAQLGLGKLHSYDEMGRAVVHFSGEGTRILAPTTPFTRVKLSEATPVRFRTPTGDIREGEVLGFLVVREDGGFVYSVLCGDEVHEIWEGALMPADGGGPLQLLRSYRWDTPANYLARWALADLNARWHAISGGFPTMLGARVQPLGHQIYAARRVLFDRAPRFILADEVGLGKTIEAGLIVQALQAEDPDYSVLVIAPGSMSRQWLTETYLRFGARAYHHLDRGRLARESRATIADLATQARVIVATTALEADPVLAERLMARRWNMVIVDEAHQIAQGSLLYDVVERLAAQSDGLLLLSATPSKRDIAGLMGLLALVAPDAYADQKSEDLQAKYDQQSAVWDRLNFTRKLVDAVAAEGRSLDADELGFIADEWSDLIKGDPFFDALLGRMRSGDAGAAVELVAYVQEFHRLDHRIVRTRRATLGHGALQWPERQLVEVAWSPSQAEGIFLGHLEALPTGDGEASSCLRALYQRACATSPTAALRFLELRSRGLDTGPAGKLEGPIARLAADPGPNDEPLLVAELAADLLALEGEADWLRTAMALAQAWAAEAAWGRAEALEAWLDNHLTDPDHQVLVFVQDAPSAAELAARLTVRYGNSAVAEFHGGVDEVDLAATAFRFQHDRRCRILVSDELGGEGRNFQNASAVAHFDLPTSCARLEQRIGRLDRVGRASDAPVLSLVLEPATPAEAALLAAQRDIFQVFTRSIGGLEFVLPRLQRDVLSAYGEGAAALRALAKPLAAEVAAALDASDESFDLSLDATKPQLDRAMALAAQIAESRAAPEEISALRAWAQRLGIQARRHEDGRNEFRWTNGSLNVARERLRVGAGHDDEARLLSGVFDRHVALEREDRQFFAPGHDLIDTLIWEAEHAEHSRVTAFTIEGFPKHRGTLLLQVLARSTLDSRQWRGHEIGAGLAARATAMLSPEALAEVMLVWDARGAHQDVVTHPRLRSLLDQPRADLRLRSIEPANVSSASFAASLWEAIDKAVPVALASVARRREAVAQERATQLDAGLRAEIGYLRWRAQTDAANAETHNAAIAARAALVDSVRYPRVELMGLALVALV